MKVYTTKATLAQWTVLVIWLVMYGLKSKEFKELRNVHWDTATAFTKGAKVTQKADRKNMLNNSKTYVCLEAEIHCNWNEAPPVYRTYVNDELFAERTFIWTNVYLVETLQLAVVPGKYWIK